MNKDKFEVLREKFKARYGNRIQEYSVNIADWWLNEIQHLLDDRDYEISKKR